MEIEIFLGGKTNILVFSQRKIGEEYKLKLYGRELERVNVVKLFGLWCDPRLTWRIHGEQMVTKCKRVFNVIRCIAGKEWGTDRTTLKSIYLGLIRSVVDCGCIAYATASISCLTKLDIMQAQALRICCGAFRSTSIPALQVEMGEMPEIRRQQ